MPAPLLIAGAVMSALAGIAGQIGANKQRQAYEDAMRRYAATILGVPQDMAGERIPLKVAQYMMSRGYSGGQMPTYQQLNSGAQADAMQRVSGGVGTLHQAPAARAAGSAWDVSAKDTNARQKTAYGTLSSQALLGAQKSMADFEAQRNALLQHAVSMPSPPADYTPAVQALGAMGGMLGNYYFNRPTYGLPFGSQSAFAPGGGGFEFQPGN